MGEGSNLQRILLLLEKLCRSVQIMQQAYKSLLQLYSYKEKFISSPTHPAVASVVVYNWSKEQQDTRPCWLHGACIALGQSAHLATVSQASFSVKHWSRHCQREKNKNMSSYVLKTCESSPEPVNQASCCCLVTELCLTLL